MLEENTRRLEALYIPMEDYSNLTALASELDDDSLLTVISSRPGSISHDSSFEKLPRLLGREFTSCSLILLYPEKFDDSAHSLNLS